MSEEKWKKIEKKIAKAFKKYGCKYFGYTHMIPSMSGERSVKFYYKDKASKGKPITLSRDLS